MKDMDKAAQRVSRALAGGETVSGKKCKGCLPKEVPGNNGNGGLWYGCNTAENSNRQEYSGIMRQGVF